MVCTTYDIVAFDRWILFARIDDYFVSGFYCVFTYKDDIGIRKARQMEHGYMKHCR